MSGKRSRNKGAAGERELLRILRDELGDMVPDRRLTATRDGGHDFVLGPFVCEVKRTELYLPKMWWAQAVVQWLDVGEHEAPNWIANNYPAVLYRQSRQPWRAIVPLRALGMEVDGPMEHWSSMDWTATVSILAFCACCRELIE